MSEGGAGIGFWGDKPACGSLRWLTRMLVVRMLREVRLVSAFARLLTRHTVSVSAPLGNRRLTTKLFSYSPAIASKNHIFTLRTGSENVMRGRIMSNANTFFIRKGRGVVDWVDAIAYVPIAGI